MRVRYVNIIRVYTLCEHKPMKTIGERLKAAREASRLTPLSPNPSRLAPTPPSPRSRPGGGGPTIYTIRVDTLNTIRV